MVMLRRLENLPHPEDDATLFHAIVERQPEPICRFLVDGSLVFVNQAFARLFHQPREQLLCANYFSLLGEEARRDLQNRLLSLSPAQPTCVLEQEFSAGDDSKQWDIWTIVGDFDHAGRLTEAQAIGHDITVWKMACLTDARQTRKLNALHNATVVLLSTLNLEPLLGQILDAAASAIPAAAKGMIHLIARDTGQLEMRAILGYQETDPRIQRFTFPGKKGYIAQAVSERRSLLISNAQADWPINPSLPLSSAEADSAAIVAPLMLEDHVLGALSLESTSPAVFTSSDLDLIESFAAIATAAIRNALLHAEVQKQAITDPLTGVYNRRALFDLGKREVERAHRFRRPLTAIMLDIDCFKTINDTFGHEAGDQVLRIIAEQCCSNIRKVDIVGRYGGDEFAILLPEIDTHAVGTVAERLRQSIAEVQVPRGGKTLTITASLGIARVSPEIPNIESLLHRADSALYTAKQSGRNRIEVSQ
jgi:diguanylate cyclase (GGDEF)-like protein